MADNLHSIGSEEGNKAKAQPSGYTGDNPATSGTGKTDVRSNTPENAANRLDPSAPGETGTTPGSNAR